MQNAIASRHHPISARALSIVRGLRRSGRTTQVHGTVSAVPGDRWATLDRVGGGFYFVSRDGAELRRGDNLIDADPLNPGFADHMAGLGAEKTVASPAS